MKVNSDEVELKYSMWDTEYYTRVSVSRDTARAEIKWKPPYTSDNIWLKRIGNIVIATGNVKFTGSANCEYNTANESIPSGYKPMSTIGYANIQFNHNNFSLLITTSGTVTMLGNPQSMYSPGLGVWITDDNFPGQHSVSPKTLSPTLKVTKDGGHIYAQRCGNIVHISFFASLNDLPTNGNSKLIMSGLPKAIVKTTGFIAAQYASYVGYFFVDTDGCLYLENKSDCNGAYWVVGNITYFTND